MDKAMLGIFSFLHLAAVICSSLVPPVGRLLQHLYLIILISSFSLAIDMQVFELNHAVRELDTCCFSG